MHDDKIKKHFIKEYESYYRRNNEKEYLPENDRILRVAEQLVKMTDCSGFNWCEIGCSDAKRFKHLKKYGFSVCGVEPGKMAANTAIKNGERVQIEDAASFRFDYKFDVLHLGFFLYLCPPSEYFSIAQNLDKHLKEGGFLIIEDFDKKSFEVKQYSHDASISMFKTDFSSLFAWHPSYKMIHKNTFAKNINDENLHESIVILFKTNPIKN
jgi:hypothetical protein